MKKTVATKKVIAKKSVIKKVKKSIASVKKSVTKKSSPYSVVSVGSKVPRFALPSSSGDIISSAGLLGSRYVLYFYPKDETTGCAIEAREFTTLGKKFARVGVQVFGVSPDNIESHLRFIKKDKISFPLLADERHSVAEQFGIWVEKSMYGKKYMGINRSTFVIGADGKIESTYLDVTPEGHAVCVLEDVK